MFLNKITDNQKPLRSHMHKATPSRQDAMGATLSRKELQRIVADLLG
jgi:hypothetical protein